MLYKELERPTKQWIIVAYRRTNVVHWVQMHNPALIQEEVDRSKIKVGVDVHERGDDTFALEDARPLLNHNVLCPEGRRGGVQVPSTDGPARLF